MDVKLPTVKTHVSHILDKLDVKRRAEPRPPQKSCGSFRMIYKSCACA